MEKVAIKSIIYGGINELMQNEKYYRYSNLGRDYCRWTDEGRQALEKFLDDVTFRVYEAEQQSLDQRSKDILIKELKS